MYFIKHWSVANNINVMQHFPYYTNLHSIRHSGLSLERNSLRVAPRFGDTSFLKAFKQWVSFI